MGFPSVRSWAEATVSVLMSPLTGLPPVLMTLPDYDGLPPVLMTLPDYDWTSPGIDDTSGL